MQGMKNGAPTDQSLGAKAASTATRIVSQHGSQLLIGSLGIFAVAMVWFLGGIDNKLTATAAYGGALTAWAVTGKVC